MTAYKFHLKRHNSPFGHLMYWPERETAAWTTRRKTLLTLLTVTPNRSATARAGSWFAILHKKSNTCFSGAMTSRPLGFPSGMFPVCIISLTRSWHVSLVMRKWVLNSSGKYRGIVASKLSSMRVKFLCVKQLTAENRITSSSSSTSSFITSKSSKYPETHKNDIKTAILNRGREIRT